MSGYHRERKKWEDQEHTLERLSKSGDGNGKMEDRENYLDE